MTEGKRWCKILPGSLILSKVFLHSTLRCSSRVLSPNVSCASQYNKWGWMMNIARIWTLSMSCTRLSVRPGCQTWQAYSRIERIRLWKVTSRSASPNTLLLSTLIILSFWLTLVIHICVPFGYSYNVGTPIHGQRQEIMYSTTSPWLVIQYVFHAVWQTGHRAILLYHSSGGWRISNTFHKSYWGNFVYKAYWLDAICMEYFAKLLVFFSSLCGWSPHV